MSRRVAIVVAAIDARATLAASLSRFVAEAADEAELVLVDASRDGTADLTAQLFPRVRLLRRPPGRLAPELWRDGLRATGAPLVAFSTAAMVPRPGWLSALVQTLDHQQAAAVGGVIAPAEQLGACDRAVYLHRYLGYGKSQQISPAYEPPGDNGLYRRASLAGLEPTLDRGFWEVAVHRSLRQRGQRLAHAPGAVVEFHGGVRLGTFLAQRFAHARTYAADRALGWSRAQRLARAAAAPAVPAVLLARIARRVARIGEPCRPWLSAAAALVPILAAWACGEAAGTLLGHASPRTRTGTAPSLDTAEASA